MKIQHNNNGNEADRYSIPGMNPDYVAPVLDESLNLEHYPMFAELFFFPREDYKQNAQAMHQYLQQHFPAAAEEFAPFMDFVDECSVQDIQELYTRSFDVQSITTLDLGYVMFGDDYKRGALLVNLTRELREAKLEARNELADFLPNVLRLLHKMEDKVLAQELVAKIVNPSLTKVVGEFNPNRVEKKNKVYRKHQKTILETSEKYPLIYKHPLAALLYVLRADFNVGDYKPPRQTADFLRSIGTEIVLEKES